MQTTFIKKAWQKKYEIFLILALIGWLLTIYFTQVPSQTTFHEIGKEYNWGYEDGKVAGIAETDRNYISANLTLLSDNVDSIVEPNSTKIIITSSSLALLNSSLYNSPLIFVTVNETHAIDFKAFQDKQGNTFIRIFNRDSP